MIDIGSGAAVVLVPGLQGRWEWMRPGVEALASRCRVVAYSLCDERTSGFPCDPARGFENYVSQVGMVMDRARLDRAVVVGVSFGGPIAVEFGARHADRVAGLVLVSAMPPDWEPDGRARFYLRAPRVLSPAFVVTAPLRMRREVAAAFPNRGDRVRFAAASAWRVARTPPSPARMARRLLWMQAHAFADPRSITAPALIVTGEPALDRVVPVEMTRRYLDRLPAARHVMLPRTGHLGVITKPVEFARIVGEFAESAEGVGRGGRSSPPLERLAS